MYALLLTPTKNISSIEETLKLIDHYGVSIVVLVLLIFFSWFLINFILKRITSQEKKMDELITKILSNENHHDHGLTHEKLSNFASNSSKVQQINYSLLNDFGADRLSIYEYHNGGKTINGVDFKKCSNTYEAVGLGIEEKYLEHQNIPISVNFLWSKLLNEKKTTFISDVDDLEKCDETIYAFLKQHNIKSYYSKLIKDFDNKPIGFIVIVYYKHKTYLTQKQLKKLNEDTFKIAGLINKD